MTLKHFLFFTLTFFWFPGLGVFIITASWPFGAFTLPVNLALPTLWWLFQTFFPLLQTLWFGPPFPASRWHCFSSNGYQVCLPVATHINPLTLGPYSILLPFALSEPPVNHLSPQDSALWHLSTPNSFPLKKNHPPSPLASHRPFNRASNRSSSYPFCQWLEMPWIYSTCFTLGINRHSIR